MKLLKIPQAADRLSVSVATIRREIDRGNLPAVRVGKVLRIDEDDLATYVEANTTASVA